jgi:hypothetical protein
MYQYKLAILNIALRNECPVSGDSTRTLSERPRPNLALRRLIGDGCPRTVALELVDIPRVSFFVEFSQRPHLDEPPCPAPCSAHGCRDAR